MRLADVLPDAGRPVAYYPQLRRLTGSVNATLLLCQLIYWSGKEATKDGWISKRVSVPPEESQDFDHPAAQSLAQETGLSYWELWKARRSLGRKGFIRERHDRVLHRCLFKVNFEAIQIAWRGLTQTDQIGDRQSPNWSRPTSELARANPLNGTYIDYTETTTERPAATDKTTLEQPGQETTDKPFPTTPLEAAAHPDIQLFREVCGRIPAARDYRTVIETMRHFSAAKGAAVVEHLRPFWLAWSSRRRRSDGRPYDPGSLTWLIEWAMNDAIPTQLGGRHAKPQEEQGAERRLSEEDLDTAERINKRRRRADVQSMPRSRAPTQGLTDR